MTLPRWELTLWWVSKDKRLRLPALNGVWLLLPHKLSGCYVDMQNIHSGVTERLMSHVVAGYLADGTMTLRCLGLGLKRHGTGARRKQRRCNRYRGAKDGQKTPIIAPGGASLH